MTAERGPEDAFLGAPGAEPPRPPRREPALLARNPVLAVVVLAASAWLLAELWPDLVYFASSREPIDLGGPGANHLERARDNRLAQIRGELVEAVAVTEGRSAAPRTVGRVAGTSLVVDRPGRGGPPVFEGRLLPAKARAGYGDAVRAMRERGSAVGEAFAVLRDGERPRTAWRPVVGAALLAALSLVNLRALLRRVIA